MRKILTKKLSYYVIDTVPKSNINNFDTRLIQANRNAPTIKDRLLSGKSGRRSCIANTIEPPEITRAIKNLHLMRKEDMELPANIFLHYIWLLGTFSGIMTISYLLSSAIEIKENLVVGGLTALAILAGFLVNLMLYTGNSENLSTLNHNLAEKIAIDIRLLLRFQVRTFLIYIITILYGLLWFIVPQNIGKTIIETILFAGMAGSICFSAILPFQLYEIHTFLLDEVIKKKKTEAQEKLNSLL